MIPPIARLLAVQTKDEAEALITEHTADIMSWLCWCVAPHRDEAERIARGDFVYTIYQHDRTRVAEAEKLFGYKLAKELTQEVHSEPRPVVE